MNSTRRVRRGGLTLLSLTALLAGCRGDAGTGTIAVRDAWVRETSPAVPVSAGYATVENGLDREVRLVGASSPRAGRVELHTMDMRNGVARMRQVTDGLPLPAGGSVALEPGGYHLMLLDLAAPVRGGEQVPITFRFDSAPAKSVNFAARSAAQGAAHGHQ